MEPPARPSSAPRSSPPRRHPPPRTNGDVPNAPGEGGSWGLTLPTVVCPLPAGLSPSSLCHCPSSGSGDVFCRARRG